MAGDYLEPKYIIAHWLKSTVYGLNILNLILKLNRKAHEKTFIAIDTAQHFKRLQPGCDYTKEWR